MERSRKSFVALAATAVTLLSTVGVFCTADRSVDIRANDHHGSMHRGYFDDKNDDTSDLKHVRSGGCVIVSRTMGCPVT